MIRIILKTLWFNRTKNGILFVEFMLISVVFIIAFNFIFSQIKLINQPLGYDYENVVTVSLLKKKRDTVMPGEKAFLRKLESLNGVKLVCRADRQSQPFSGSSSRSTAKISSSDKPPVPLYQYGVDEHYAELLNLELQYGRWFRKNDTSAIIKPVAITSNAALELFDTENALNRSFSYRGDSSIVVGIVKYFKPYTYTQQQSGIFLPDYIGGTNNRNRSVFAYLVKYRNKPDMSAIEDIYTLFNQSQVSENHRLFDIKTLKSAKSGIDLEFTIVFYGVIAIIFFLLLNVMAGLAGLLWQTIKQRYYEFALRMAVGATKSQIRQQVVLEMIVLVVLALVPTFIILSQIEMEDIGWSKDHISTVAVILSAVLLVALSVIFTYIPSYRASKTQPAIALKGE